MIRLLAALAAALACLAATPALAQTAGKSSPEAVAGDAALMEAWLSDLAAWVQSHIDLTHRSVQIVGAALRGAQQASAGDGDVEGARGWVARQRAALAAVETEFAAIPDAPPALPAGLSPDQRSEGEAVRALSLEGYRASRAVVEVLPGKLDPLYNTIVQAVGGDAAARGRLQADVVDLSILLMGMENAGILASRVEKGHPQRGIQDASLESNLAIIAMLEYRRDVIAGKRPDGAAAARTMRQHARLTREAADVLEQDLEGWRADLMAGGSGDASLDRRIEQVIALYAASVGVERQLADALDGVAARVEAGDMAGIDPAYAPVARLIQQRLSLDTARRQAMSAQ